MHKGFEFAVNVKGAALPSLRFHEIPQDAPEHIVHQLVGHDRVHSKGVQTIEELRRYRLGGEGFNRTCYALLDAQTVISAIYVHKGYKHIESDRDLSGNVAEILQEETAADNREPKSKIFYSISNIKNLSGAGQHLVVDMYGHLTTYHPQASRSTLSPLRTFDKAFSPEDDLNFSLMPSADKKRAVLNYLLKGEDAVQQFHMGNGARIADIKLDAGDTSVDEKTGILRRHYAMVNYAYDISEHTLQANAASFRVTKSLIRAVDMDPDERAERIRSGIMARVSETVLEDAGMSPPRYGFASSRQARGHHLDI